MSLGSRLKKERERRKWSQKEVAEKIGITNAVLSNYERDYRDPDTVTLKKLADLYEVETDYLLGRKTTDYYITSEAAKTIQDLIDNSNVDYIVLREKLGLSKQEYLEFKWGHVYITKEQAEVLEKYLGFPKEKIKVSKDDKDIAKRMEQIKKDLTSEDGLMFNGEPMSEEAIESFLEAMEYAVRQTQRINKKYIPKKYRDNKEN